MIDWQALPKATDGVPYDGADVYFAVPNVVCLNGGERRGLNPDLPFVIFTAYWDRREQSWYHRIDRGPDERIAIDEHLEPLWAPIEG